MIKSWLAQKLGFGSKSRRQRKRKSQRRRIMLLEQLDERAVFAGLPGTLGETVQSGFTAAELAQSLVGPGLAISNATFTGGATASGSFNFTDSTVVGFGQGIILSSGNVVDVVGPNAADSTSTDFANPGDAQLDALSTYPTHDAAVLEFDFTPTANQVVFNYAFASDEYPEWVNTPYNDVFAFYVNGTNYATVRQVAGDPNAPFVPVAVNNINDGNPLDPTFVSARPDLFRPNYVDPNGGPSAINLELDGITRVLTFQAPVNPGVVNHMKLAIADASDGIYDSAVFIQAGSLVSNENPVADLSLQPQSVSNPMQVTAIIEAEDPNGLPLTYTIDWGDGTISSGLLNSPTNESEKTTTDNHTYAANGNYIITLTVSNGSLIGTSVEDVHIAGSGGSGGGGDVATSPVVVTNPADQSVVEGEIFTFIAAASGNPSPSVQWQVSTDSGNNFVDIQGATQTTYTAIAALSDNGNLYQAVFTNDEGDAVTTAALLSVSPFIPTDTTPPDAPIVSLANDTGVSSSDNISSVGSLALSGIEDGAVVEYSVDGGSTWSADFLAVEGQDSVLVHQVDQAGNVSDVALLNFLLDTQAPLSVDPALVNDTGKSTFDMITSDGSLVLNGTETDALVEYSTDSGATWATSFMAKEGLNNVQVRQTDLAGNASGVTTLSFTLDTTVPMAPGVALAQDTGASSTDNITKVGTLAVSDAEANATLEYSSDHGATWTSDFTAKEGLNTVSVRQIDAAGNVSAVASLHFQLDTTAPDLKPTFSTGSNPILVNAQGVTLSPNASDTGGIASQTAGVVDTSAAGHKSLVCTATDLAGNTTSVTIPYTVGYAIVKVTPEPGATYKKKNLTVPVSFQLKDANGLLSDSAAANLASNVTVTFDGQAFSGVSYDKKSNTFKLNLKVHNSTVGTHTLGIHVFAQGGEVTTATLPINFV